MNELLPFASGLLLGALLGLVRPSLRLPIGALFAVVLGTLATVVSEEFRLSWAFLLIDIPLVAVSASIGFLVSQRHTRRAYRQTKRRRYSATGLEQ